MPAPTMTYKKLRRQLDDLGYYQPLVPESVPLVEALMHDLLATTHNLKQCQSNENKMGTSNQSSNQSKQKSVSEEIIRQKDCESTAMIDMKKKVSDLNLMYQESLQVIRNLQVEIEERNKKILKLELSLKAQIVTSSDKKQKAPRMEVTSLIDSSSSSSSGPTYDNVASCQDQVNVIGIYAQKNKKLESDLAECGKELSKAKEMLANVDKYWSQQVSALTKCLEE